MNLSFLPPDDLPPTEVTRADWLLSQAFDRRLSHFFAEACQQDPALEAILAQCQWFVAAQPYPPVLVLRCPRLAIAWYVLKHLPKIGSLLESLAIAKIRIYPSLTEGTSLDVRVDELLFYLDAREESLKPDNLEL